MAKPSSDEKPTASTVRFDEQLEMQPLSNDSSPLVSYQLPISPTGNAQSLTGSSLSNWTEPVARTIIASSPPRASTAAASAASAASAATTFTSTSSLAVSSATSDASELDSIGSAATLQPTAVDLHQMPSTVPTTDGLATSTAACASSSCSSPHQQQSPLTSFGDQTSSTTGARACSALVPFQKLQVDTNLNKTFLPEDATHQNDHFKDQKRRNVQFAESLKACCCGCAKDTKQHAPTVTAARDQAADLLHAHCEEEDDHDVRDSEFRFSSNFRDAWRMAGMQQEPQLSVRLRGSRVELASSNEDEQVDFLGPAENIKKLFKLAYSQTKVSLAVHRVGSTLVVDGELEDQDLPAGFEDKFPLETLKIQHQTDHPPTQKQHSPDQQETHHEDDNSEDQEQSQSILYKKFIYESTKEQAKSSANKSRSKHKPKHKKTKNANKSGELQHTQSGDQQEEVVASFQSQRQAHAASRPPAQHHAQPNRSTSRTVPPQFERVLKWRFNDLKMVLGSDLLLFRNKEHPAVSLRLHDMDQQISVCTILDYYLDNVIANIPELAICLHSKGLVRGYKLVQTRNIPYMGGHQGNPLFDVQDVSLNASLLLKFLQDNCSRPNGTYWLYRKEGENSLRLYDVNVLSQGKQMKWKYMMAMLCYRFASRANRLLQCAQDAPHLQVKLQQRQRELLSTCLQFLEEISQQGGQSHYSICSSVSEQMADTYLHEWAFLQEDHDMTAGSRKHKTCSSSSGGGVSKDNEEQEAIETSLKKAKMYLLASIKAFEGCMEKSDEAEHGGERDDATSRGLEEEPEQERNSFSDQTFIGQRLEQDEDEDEDEDEGMGSFVQEELARLQLKYASICVQLGRFYLRNDRLESSLQSIQSACRFMTSSWLLPCHKRLVGVHDEQAIDELLVQSMKFDHVAKSCSSASSSPFGLGRFASSTCTSFVELRCLLLELLGDAASLNHHHQPFPTDDSPAVDLTVVSSYLKLVYHVVSGEKVARVDELLAINRDEPVDWKSLDVHEPMDDDDSLQFMGFSAYLHALRCCGHSDLYFSLMKKLGNASNELGKFCLEQKQQLEQAFRWFERGCKVFREIEDGVNVALLYANLAHLHKILAQRLPPDTADHRLLAKQKEAHYTQAIELCVEALRLTRLNKAELDLRRKIKGELALTYLVYGVHLASGADPNDQEVLRVFDKALALYTELKDAKQVASTHYQMASFGSRTIRLEPWALSSEHYSSSRAGQTQHRLTRSQLEIARRHYEKALDFFGKYEMGKTFVLIHREIAQLYAASGKVEEMDHAIRVLLNTYEAFQRVLHKCDGEPKESVSNAQHDTISPVAKEVSIMELHASEVLKMLRSVLHRIIREVTTALRKKPAAHAHNSTSTKRLEMYKQLYKKAIYSNQEPTAAAPAASTAAGNKSTTNMKQLVQLFEQMRTTLEEAAVDGDTLSHIKH